MLSLEWLQNTQPTKYRTQKTASAVVFYYAGCVVRQSSSKKKLVLPQSRTPAVDVK